ncbi:MAG: YihY/virulence factor BrkB family protein [Rhodobacteraceae bacterium]|nr:YihY/virulence factor BrkB family protein [Paracoccaceae bacterium]
MQLTAEKNLSLVAAGVAFYAILAVFPALAATIALWGLIGDPAQVLTQAEDFKVLIPADIFALIETQLLALAQADGLALRWASLVSFGFALYTAQAGVSALIKGLNTIYGAPNRGALRHTATAFLLTLTLIGVALVAIACVVVAPAVLAFIPLGPLAGLGIEIARWAIALTVLLTGFGLVYRIGPNHAGPKPPLLSPGTGFAVLFWMAASVGFSLYLTNFNTYNRVYGSIGAVMAMLMWLYITALLVLLGGALNSRKPST